MLCCVRTVVSRHYLGNGSIVSIRVAGEHDRYWRVASGGLGVLWRTVFRRAGSSHAVCWTDMTEHAGEVAGLTLPPPEHQHSSADIELPHRDMPQRVFPEKVQFCCRET